MRLALLFLGLALSIGTGANANTVPIKVGLIDLEVDDATLNRLDVTDVKRMTFWSRGLQPARYQFDIQTIGHGDRMAQILVDTIYEITPEAEIELFVATPIQEDPRGRLILDPAQLRFAYDWMAFQGVNVVAQTFVADNTPAQQDVYRRIQELGMVVFASAGNGPAENAVPPYPATFPDVIGISTTALKGQLAREANRHAYTDYSVPAPRISNRRIQRDPDLALEIGSSRATVRATGIAVGMIPNAETNSVGAVRRALDNVAIPIELWSGSGAYGRGVLDMDVIKALLLPHSLREDLRAG